MGTDQPSKRQSRQTFTIIKDDALDGHGGFGAGSISLENMSSVIVDPNENKAYVDMDAMHARSEVERRVRYYQDKSEVPEGKLYWIAWITVERGEQGPYYHGVAASELLIDKPNKRGYKLLGEHVSHMESSLAGKVVVEHMDEASRQLLGEFLQNHSQEMWENASEALREAFRKSD